MDSKDGNGDSVIIVVWYIPVLCRGCEMKGVWREMKSTIDLLSQLRRAAFGSAPGSCTGTCQRTD